MTEEKPEQEEEDTSKAAVEVDEKDLDQASGGAGYLKAPTEMSSALKINPGEIHPPDTNPGEAHPPDTTPDPSLTQRKY